MSLREVDGFSAQWLLISAVGFALCTTGCDDSPPKPPSHYVGTNELPVMEVESAKGFREKDFQLLQLSDGHDYWIYRHRSGERGYAAMAHSPECQKCAQKPAIDSAEFESEK